MSQQDIYESFKSAVIGKPLDVDGNGIECVDVADGLAQAYFPGHSWTELLPPVAGAKQLATNYNPNFFDWVANNHADANQLPSVGAIMVFDATPAPGYSNQFPNPDGHAGGCDSASSANYVLLQENAPNAGEYVNATTYGWKFRPCMGWLVPKLESAPAPAPTPDTSLVGKEVWLHAVPVWHVYKVGTQPIISNAIGTLAPSKYDHGPGGQPGLTYPILGVSSYAHTVTIKTDTYGEVDIYLDGDAQIL